ncbi:hypothetical protein MJO28_009644 [Puccinia striiformis f. sp. tritici]|uniref:Uncharacterized protein n=1 Tax=Puccinia striiformis f. sp. tritici TaxID=168172 RepID=A0ACC0E880_9BASI|nr:hypothetical protein MJO28_009644 [Puccinia striiformis f. sp. tritici]
MSSSNHLEQLNGKEATHNTDHKNFPCNSCLGVWSSRLQSHSAASFTTGGGATIIIKHNHVISKLERAQTAGHLCNGTVLFVFSNQSLGVCRAYPGRGTHSKGWQRTSSKFAGNTMCFSAH